MVIRTNGCQWLVNGLLRVLSMLKNDDTSMILNGWSVRRPFLKHRCRKVLWRCEQSHNQTRVTRAAKGRCNRVNLKLRSGIRFAGPVRVPQGGRQEVWSMAEHRLRRFTAAWRRISNHNSIISRSSRPQIQIKLPPLSAALAPTSLTWCEKYVGVNLWLAFLLVLSPTVKYIKLNRLQILFWKHEA